MKQNSLQGQTVLITGAGGFIGSHLCNRLSTMDVEVHAVSRTFTRSRAGTVFYIPGDLTNPDTAKSLLRGCQPAVVFHLAGLAAAARDPKLVLPTFQSNLVSTVNILVAAQELGAPRIVLPGSLEEPQDATGAPSSPYAISKWVSSAYGRMFGNLYNLPVAIGRIFITYGPTTKDLHKLIPYVILSLLEGRVPKLSSGLREVDWIHVDDVVDGLLALATAPHAVGNTLDIGSGKLVSIRSLVERIVHLINPQLTAVFDSSLDRPFEQVRIANVERTHELIDWAPKVSLNDGLMKTIEWFRRNPSLISLS